MKYALGIALFVLVFYTLHQDNDAMSACQKTSTYDECFYALNR